MIGLINRGNLPDTTQSEFENFSARLREIFLKEHNEDGTHITQDRVFNFVPVGAISLWTTDTAPTAWLLCRGQQVSRATYQGLFSVIGTTYGVGDGSTTFNVPDLQQRFPLGKAVAGTGSTLAGTGGAIDHTHTAGAVSGSTGAGGSHSHSISSAGSHSHTVNSHDHGNENLRNSTTATSAYTLGSGLVEVQAGTGEIVANGAAHFTVAPGSGYDITTDNASPGTDSQGSHDHGASTGSESSHTHGAGTLAVATGGTNNPAFISLNFIIFAGVA